jgi:predicted N-acetyltransferase YhbS
MIIRPETVQDYAGIARVTARAFNGQAIEPTIVALHRQRLEFDPDLSLVAEIDGQIIGHVLFSPRIIRLLGQDVRAVNLAPIGVDPSHQGQRIGAALIQEGHRVARDKGYAVSFLLGHVEYYPRFGYHPGVYGASSLDITPSPAPPLEARPLTESDLPALNDLWLREEGLIDFAIRSGYALLDWLSPNPAINATVYVRDNSVVGYSRIHTADPTKPRVFLARDADAAHAMAGQIGATTLPLHPYSASVSAFGDPVCTAWEAGMAAPLLASPFDDYHRLVQQGKRQPGRVIWPVEFDLG